MANDLPICDICGKNHAKIFVVRRKNGVLARRLVCLECAPGAADELAPGTTEPQRLYQAILDRATHSNDSSFKCNLCGTQLADIISEGRPGCCLCYTRFDNELTQVIESVQPGRYHTGKTPPQ